MASANQPALPWPRPLRLAARATGALLFLTGVVWMAAHYSVGAGAGELPHPIEPWAMRLHGLAALVAVYILGMLGALHVPRGWRLTACGQRPHQRTTGVLLCGLAAALVATGYMLYYFAPESTRPALGWAHALDGVAFGVSAVIHGRRQRVGA